MEFFLTIFVCLLLVILMEAWRRSKSRNLPPGPWKLPIIGNLHQFVGYQQQHERLRDLASEYGPILHIQLGQISTVVISSSGLAKEVTKTHDHNFASRPSVFAGRIIAYNGRDIVLSPYGDHWRQLKKITVLELLTTRRVQSFRSIREEEVSLLVKSITSSAGSAVNLSRMLTALSYCIVSKAAFGQSVDQKEAFTPIIHKILDLFNGFIIADLFPSVKILERISGIKSKAEKLHREMDAIIEEVIKEQRARMKSENYTESDYLLDALLNLHDRGNLDVPITNEDIKALILDMFLGGVETSATTTEWAMSEIVKHPKVMKRAQEEVRRVMKGKETIDETSLQNMPYLNAIVKETLRLHPPPILAREAQEEVELCGYRIPKKTRVMINTWAIARDPNYWTEPERFYPERFLNCNRSVDFMGAYYEYLPFGAGRRMCAGVHFATSVVEIGIASLLYHFDWTVPNGLKPEDLDTSEVFGIVIKRREELCLIPTLNDPRRR